MWQSDRVEQLEHPPGPARSTKSGVQPQRISDLSADRPQRIERDQGILQHQADVLASSSLPCAIGQPQNALPAELEPVGTDPGIRTGQTEQAAGGHAFARAGFADDGEALTRGDGERHTANDRFSCAETHPEIAHGQRGSIVTCEYRPIHTCLIRRSMLRPSTVAVTAVSTMNRPGKKLIHQAEVMYVRPADSMAPHSAVGGSAPSPR